MSKSVRATEREIPLDDVLQAAGVANDGFVPRHGWSNRTWVGPRHVVRISSGRLSGSLTHEARIVEVVSKQGLPVAPIIARGLVSRLPGQHDEAGEWLISRRLPGDTLAVLWPALAPSQRTRVGMHLGELLRTLHHIEIDDVAPPWWIEAHDPRKLRNAYRPHVDLGPLLVDAARQLPDADNGLLDDAGDMLRDRRALFAHDHHVLVHGDIHGHNLLIDPETGNVSGILDWEGAHTAPADVELDMLLRWTAAAHDFPESPSGPSTIKAGDCLSLIDSIASTYGELFTVPHLKPRLEVYDAHWHLVQLLFDRYWRDHQPSTNTGPAGAWTRLRRLLDGDSHLNAFEL